RLHNVDRENFSGYGQSVPGFIQNNRLGFGASFLINRKIKNRFSLETGLGITNFRTQFHFDYINQWNGRTVNETLYVSLFYAKIPLHFSYYFHVSNRSSTNVSLGADLRFLFFAHDNYQEIIYQLILLPTARYNFFIPSGVL